MSAGEGRFARWGREALALPTLRKEGVRGVGKRVVGDFLDDDMMTYGAAVAYHVFFALFPFLIFLISLLSFLQVPQLFAWLMEQASALLPPQAMGQVESVLGEVRGRRRGGLLSIGILVAIWTSSAGVRSVMKALNEAYEVEEGRTWWKRLVLSVGFTIAFALLVVLATALMVFGPSVAAWVAERFGLDGLVVTIWQWARIPVAIVLAMLAVSLLYHVAPATDQPFRLVTPGAVLAVLLWLAAATGFSLYVSHFGRFGVTYGSIGAVVVLLLYIYLTGIILLLGAELNAVVRREGAPKRGRKTRETDG